MTTQDFFSGLTFAVMAAAQWAFIGLAGIAPAVA